MEPKGLTYLVGEFWKWGKSVLVVEPTEQSGAHSPGTLVVLLGLFSLLESSLADNDLVETGIEVASSHVLELLSSLNQQASIWNFDWSLLTISEPDVESWILALSVNGDEVEV